MEPLTTKSTKVGELKEAEGKSSNYGNRCSESKLGGKKICLKLLKYCLKIYHR